MLFILFICFVIFILPVVQQPPTRKIGSIADYDPLNDNYGSLGSGFRSAGHPGVANMFRGMLKKQLDSFTNMVKISLEEKES